MKNYISLDIGGSSIKYALMDENTHILEKSTIITPHTSLETFLDTIQEIHKQFATHIEGIAISMPGIIDPDQGYCYTGGALSYIHNIPLSDIIQEKCHCNVTIGNDAKCAANAEIGYGSLQDVEDAICVILGTGIGGCLIKNHKVHTGKHFSAGEFSFIQTSLVDGFDAAHVWAQISGIQGLSNCVKKHTKDGKDLSGFEIFDMANLGDKKVLEGLYEFSRNIAIELFNLHMIFDAEKIAIGGGISAQNLLIDFISKNLEFIFDQIPFQLPRTSVVPCKFRNDANLIGALYQFLQKYH